ncbi:putative Rho-GTPase-activating protein 6 [Ilyonectria robusta]
MDPFASSDNLRNQPAPTAIPPRRMLPSVSSGSFNFPQSVPMRNVPNRGPQMRTSRTWTISSGERGLLSDTDEVGNRAAFVQEYNRLAKKHGVRVLVVEDFDLKQAGTGPHSPQKRGWFYRILRSTSGQTPTVLRPRTLEGRSKRSVSDLAHNLAHPRRETPKTVDIQSMIRLSGKSVFYLPPEHAPSALVLPTCLRATAHYLAQNVATRGIFRIPGSVRVVNTLFDYYCHTEKGGIDIAGTVRCANLPMHIQVSVHDVASTFKRLLSILPGGILGSLHIFDALVAIHSQLNGDPEFPRTKQTKVRARLIALAISTIQSQFRRELVCAVFGLLSLIGRVAEVAPREDDGGRPLPTGDLMGYCALGIVFGPLLLGDLLDSYSMKLATPDSGLLLFHLSPPKHRRDRRKSKAVEFKSITAPAVNKILIANGITEMLIANWRDIVRQMKSLGMQRGREVPSLDSLRTESLQQSTSESFVIRKPPDWEQENAYKRDMREEEEFFKNVNNGSPEPDTPTLAVRRQRLPKRKSSASNRLGARPSIGVLSPTAEESAVDEESREPVQSHQVRSTLVNDNQASGHRPSLHILHADQITDEDSWTDPTPQRVSQSQHDRKLGSVESHERPSLASARKRRETTGFESPRVSIEVIPPRTSSKQRHDTDLSTQHELLPHTHLENVVGRTPNTEPTPIERRKAQRAKQGGKDRSQILDQKVLNTEEHEQSKPSRSFSFSNQQDEKLAGIEDSQAQQNGVKAGFQTPSNKLILSYSERYPDSSSITEPSRPSFQSESSQHDSNRGKRLSAVSSVEPHQTTGKSFSSIDQSSRVRKSPQSQGSAFGKSVDRPRKEFYAAMRIPPGLSGQSTQSGQDPSGTGAAT